MNRSWVLAVTVSCLLFAGLAAMATAFDTGGHSERVPGRMAPTEAPAPMSATAATGTGGDDLGVGIA